jgi:hypothetical protein
MPQHKSKSPSASPGRSTVTKQRSRITAKEQTIEERLLAKAKVADTIDVTKQRSLGQMTIEEQCRILFGE